MYRYAFFDLDGTLTQSEFGIINSIIYALNGMGIEVEDRESIKRFIGPPLVMAFMDLYGMSEEDAKKAAALYREHYNAGEMYNAPLYPGIEDMLKSLSEAGVILYVVTSKPTFFAQRIVEHFGILPYFEKVIGPELGNIDYSKEELVKLALDDLRSDPKDCIMVGDRHFDIEGARANNIDSIGVLYGYGSEDELKEAGATFIARDAAEVRDLICVKEIWDAYDADHNVIEGVRLIRGEESKIPKGTYHLVCDILLRHKDGSYLLMQRDPRKTCPLMWEATAGGSALKGETPLMCAMRELKEETGISTGKMTEVRRSIDDGRHCLYVGFCCETGQDKESVTLQEGETVSFKWVSAEEILKMTKDELCTVRMRPFIR